ncbi:Mucin-associated surface protein (MASP) [Trypanosoma cruzi]|uniref:Mucin-associated surface protein (MASP) n=1 Tax=Trypanosoma cruzi TaxID=5693 RepID=A0A2V2V1A6_TRYCR|nr:Mucin-associated surface protein (MASP) [Trypanosoma cruzi]
MMMMMTGRVLLVCALCVLWCGVCGGGCSEAIPLVPPDNASSKEKPQNQEEAVVGELDQKAQQVAPQVPTPTGPVSQELPEKSLQAQQPGGGASIMPSTTMDNQDQKEGKNEEKKKEQAKQQEEAKDEEEEEEEEEDEEEEDEEEEDDKKEEGDTKKEEAVTGTTEGTSTGTEEQPSLSSAADGASNITNPNSTQTTGDDDPAADGAGTAEGKQNENKDANPKETPVTAAAMKNITATTGDSDGSTAVSHTTSPLLLLLVVACAAAAAVVAA